MAITTSDLEVAPDDILAHYGVKGMRWGVRRSRAQIDADSADAATKKSLQGKVAKNRTTDVLSNQELQALNTRMNLEQQYSQLTSKEKAANQTALKKGAGWAGNFVKDVANQQAKNMTNAIVKEALEGKAIQKGLLKEKSKKKKQEED